MKSFRTTGSSHFPETLYVDRLLNSQIVQMPSGQRALKLNGLWSEKIPELYRKYECDFIWLSTGVSAEVLEGIIRLQLTSSLQFMGQIVNLGLVEGATFLESLTVQTTHAAKLNLSKLKLRELSCRKNDIAKGASLPLTLEKLSLSSYSGEDIVALKELIRLTSLILIQPKQLTNLAGIEGLQNLQSLEIYYATRLENLEAIKHQPVLNRLVLEHCKNIDDISPVANLKNLKTLYLNYCGSINSLSPVMKLERLEDLLFTGGTKILDGKIAQLQRLPALRRGWFQNRRHYDTTREELQESLA